MCLDLGQTSSVTLSTRRLKTNLKCETKLMEPKFSMYIDYIYFQELNSMILFLKYASATPNSCISICRNICIYRFIHVSPPGSQGEDSSTIGQEGQSSSKFAYGNMFFKVSQEYTLMEPFC